MRAFPSQPPIQTYKEDERVPPHKGTHECSKCHKAPPSCHSPTHSGKYAITSMPAMSTPQTTTRITVSVVVLRNLFCSICSISLARLACHDVIKSLVSSIGSSSRRFGCMV